MATKIGDLFFDVYADVTKAAKSVDGLGDRFKQVGSTAARAIGETVANATAIAVAGLGAMTAATLNAGAAYNTLGQSATAAFSTVYDDLAAANGILKEISELNLETPFRGSSLVRTARTLAGFGVEEENILEITEALTQAIAGMGLGSAELQRVAIQFGQIESRGRLAGDEARALANYGIDAFGILADALNLPVEKVRELSEEFKLTSDVAIPALINGINSRFAGATEKLFNTATGQAEGLRAVFEAVGSAIVEPFIGFSGGGAIVEAMSSIRLELTELISVADDGSFVLEGFLEPLAPVLQNIADSVVRVSEGFASFLGGLDSSSLSNVFMQLEGTGPALAAIGAGFATVFAQAIPFLGRLVAGFNPIVVGISALIAASPSLRSEFAGAFQEIWAAVEPLIPQVQELVRQLVSLAEDAGPAVADILVAAFEGLAPILGTVLAAANELLPVIGPVLVSALEALADVLEGLVAIMELLGPEVTTAVIALAGLAYIAPITTATIAFTAANVGLVASLGVLATALGTVATAAGIALAALGSYNAIKAGVTGDINYLNEDVAFYEKPFQLAGRFGFALGGGDREAAQYVSEIEAAEAAAADFNQELLMGVENFADARAQALQWAGALGVSADASDHFANLVALAWDEQKNAQLEAVEGTDDLTDSLDLLNAELEESVDYLGILEDLAKRAWEQVDRLSQVGSGATIDDFLRELPDLAKSLTDALGEAPSILRDLNIDGVLGDVKSAATAVIQQLAREYGLGVDEIKSLLDQRGLAAVIEALGQITEETTQTVDPLVAKYAQLGATAEQLRGAISRLEDQRTTALKAQIDQVKSALDDATEAAKQAREAFDAYFLGSTGGLQGAIDKLVLDIPNVGSQIEEGLLKGGPQGEAAVRQALNDVGGQLSEIFRLGLEQGLSPDQIIAMLGPVYGSISQEVGGALNRISSLDWSEGFTPQAAAEIQAWLSGILNPSMIAGLFGQIGSADSRVSGLQAQLEGLQAQLNIEVEFSAEQVQGAMDEIQTETMVEAVITPEAAQMVYDAIQDVFDNDDLKAAVDEALITQQILDAAKDAEDMIQLRLDTGLAFDYAQLSEVARSVSEQFYAEFNNRLRELRDEAAQQYGFENFSQMTSALGPAVANATIGVAPVFNQTINNDIAVSGAQSPTATASEVVAASSAAAGSGGQYDPSKYYRPLNGPY